MDLMARGLFLYTASQATFFSQAACKIPSHLPRLAEPNPKCAHNSTLTVSVLRLNNKHIDWWSLLEALHSLGVSATRNAQVRANLLHGIHFSWTSASKRSHMKSPEGLMENEYLCQSLLECAIMAMQELIQIQPVLVLFGRPCNFCHIPAIHPHKIV